MLSHRILCAIGKEFAPEGKKILVSIGHVDYCTPTQQELLRICGQYHIIVTQLGLRFDEELLRRARILHCIATATTSADHIDGTAARKRGIAVLSLKGATAFLRTIPSTAEHTWGLLLALLRHTVPAADAVRAGRWESPPFRGTELRGKTIGIVGVGRLGTMAARYGKAFGMTVIGYDIRNFPRTVCQKVSLQALLQRSDVISLHTHLTKETEGMIGAEELTQMKPTAVLVNTARGRIVDERALLAALRTKRIAGYAADVLAGEVLFGNNCSRDPLVHFARTHDNVLLTPHIGGRTREARTATDAFIARRVAAWSRTHTDTRTPAASRKSPPS